SGASASSATFAHRHYSTLIRRREVGDQEFLDGTAAGGVAVDGAPRGNAEGAQPGAACGSVAPVERGDRTGGRLADVTGAAAPRLFTRRRPLNPVRFR